MEMLRLLKVSLLLGMIGMEGVSAQAPGDESADCVDPEGAFFEAPPENQRVLMDSRNYLNLLGTFGIWDIRNIDGDSGKWTTALGGTCLRTVRVCAESPPQNNWLFTQHIAKDVAQGIDTYDITIFVHLTWSFSTCDPSAGCDRTMNVYNYITNTPQSRSTSTGFRDVSRYTLMNSITSTGGDTTLSFTLSSSQDAFYLGFQDPGTCVNLNRVTVFRYRCKPMQVGLVLYPDTQSPTTRDVSISASCVDNASHDISPTVRCSSEGVWSGSPTCSCDCGYKLAETEGVQRCDACPARMYLSDSDSTCQSCPSETITTGVGVCECPCSEGHFRAPGEGPAVGCTRPPTTITNLRVIGTTSTTITVRWNKPTVTGRSDYYYVVNYTDPDGVGDVYIQDNSRLVVSNTQVTYTVDGADGSGLQADTKYIIRVSVHNGVSDLDGENADDRIQQVQVATPEGVPGPPSNVQSLCNVIVWGIPNEPNGEIIGYDVQFQKVGTSRVSDPITREASELYVVVDKTDLPSGDGEFEVQVRAKNSLLGEWSNYVLLGPGCPMNFTLITTEPPTTESPTTITNGTRTPTESDDCSVTKVSVTPSGTVFWELSDDCDGKVGKVTFEWRKVDKDGEVGEVGEVVEVTAPTNTWYQLPVSKLEDGVEYILLVRFEGVEGDNLEVEQGRESEFTFDADLPVMGANRVSDDGDDDDDSNDIIIAVVATFSVTVILLVTVFVLIAVVVKCRSRPTKETNIAATNGKWM